jgi:uncharacterized protein YggE
MEEKSVQHIISATSSIRTMAAAALGLLALFLLVATVSELRSYSYIGEGIQPSNTITVTGEGKVVAVPDTATFTYTVDETAPDVASAQAAATKASNAVIAYLTGAGVASTDIQTTDYNVNPQYEYGAQVCTNNGYCPPGKQTISGYEVTQTESVKVEDISQAGTLLAGVGTRGISDVSSLTFTVADEDTLDDQARSKAITDAQTKAKALASELGVSLVRVTSFNENSGTVTPQPMYAMATNASAGDSVPVAPTIATGQNTITSDVSVTYEIR